MPADVIAQLGSFFIGRLTREDAPLLAKLCAVVAMLLSGYGFIWLIWSIIIWLADSASVCPLPYGGPAFIAGFALAIVGGLLEWLWSLISKRGNH